MHEFSWHMEIIKVGILKKKKKEEKYESTLISPLYIYIEFDIKAADGR